MEGKPHTIEWLREFGLPSPARPFLLEGQRYLFPAAATARAEVLNDWIAWLLDAGRADGRADDLAASAGMSLSLERQLCPVHPLGGMLEAPPATALHDLCRRSIPFLDSCGADRVLARVLDMVVTRQREEAERRARIRPSLDYRIYQLRRTSGAAVLVELRRMAVDVTAACSGVLREKYDQLELMATDVIAWSADIAAGDSAAGLAATLEREVPTTPRNARERIAEMIRHRLDLFEHVAATACKNADSLEADAAAEFAHGLRTLMEGHRRMLGAAHGQLSPR
jgi:hypothetical protein